jgi:hypothetical protein
VAPDRGARRSYFKLGQNLLPDRPIFRLGVGEASIEVTFSIVLPCAKLNQGGFIPKADPAFPASSKSTYGLTNSSLLIGGAAEASALVPVRFRFCPSQDRYANDRHQDSTSVMIMANFIFIDRFPVS